MNDIFIMKVNQGLNNNAIRLGANGSLGYAEGLTFKPKVSRIFSNQRNSRTKITRQFTNNF